MSGSFERFLSLPDQARKDVFEAAARRLRTRSRNIEKDFWVCFVLDVLYNRLSDEHLQLLFKGGTTLSKAFSLIYRFSEDVDIVVDRNGLGFGTDQDPFSSGLSGKERGRRFKKLKDACSAYVCGKLASSLNTFLAEWCSILPDEYDEQTLLIKYPTFYPNEGAGYVLPHVKLEGGARSAVAPSTIASATPYISEEFLEGWSFEVANLHVIEPARTYLDKLLILHGTHCRYRDEKRLPREGHRISRHYYDAAMVTGTGTGQAALADKTLFDDVCDHSSIAFPAKWKKLDEARQGSVHLIPQEDLRVEVENDYTEMQDMIFGDPPPFDWVLAQLHEAQKALAGC